MSNSIYGKKYKKSFLHSYTLGPFPTFELLNKSPENAICVYMSENFNEKEKLETLCKKTGVNFSYAGRILETISNKEICYAAAAFNKFTCVLEPARAHIALVNPSDMGNLGTILRTALSFGIHDIALIEPCADIFNPKVIRASMGAVFSLRFSHYSSYGDYMTQNPGREHFPFMLDGGTLLTPENCPESDKYTLIFGNEATGLSKEFQDIGKSIFIGQSDEVDSLNLSISVGIGAYIFTQCNGGIL